MDSNNTTKKDDNILIWIGMAVILLTFIYFFAITFINIPINNQKYSDLIIGYVSGVVSAIVGFYWGGAHGGPKTIDTSKLSEQPIIVPDQEQIDQNGVNNVNSDNNYSENDSFYYQEDEMAPPLKG